MEEAEDLSEVKTVNGKNFHWCKYCNHGKGFWRTHKLEDCQFNKKKEGKESSSSDLDNGGSLMLVMDIVDTAFLGMMS